MIISFPARVPEFTDSFQFGILVKVEMDLQGSEEISL
jgi:hypothetical protein